jgi:hypothetical protein
MTTRAFFWGGGLLMMSVAPVFGDNFTARVISYDPALGIIIFDDLSQLAGIPGTVIIPDIRKGDVVTVDIEASENGYETINSITIKSCTISRHLPPTPKKSG